MNFQIAAEWLLNQEHCTREHEGQVWYKNEATGVYFVFENNTRDDPEESPIPPEYEDAGLSFNLNFNRPSFFGHEAMPFVERLATNFGLVAMDGDAQPIGLTSDFLISRWSKSNDWAQKAIREAHDMPTPYSMPRAKSLAWWRYAYARENLQREVGEGVFVPSFFLWRRKDAHQVRTYLLGLPAFQRLCRNQTTLLWCANGNAFCVLPKRRLEL